MTFERARKFLGLNHCQQFLNMGMGLPSGTLDFFLSVNIPIMELYGLSECTGLHTVSNLQAYRILRWVWMGLCLPSGQQPNPGIPRIQATPKARRLLSLVGVAFLFFLFSLCGAGLGWRWR